MEAGAERQHVNACFHLRMPKSLFDPTPPPIAEKSSAICFQMSGVAQWNTFFYGRPKPFKTNGTGYDCRARWKNQWKQEQRDNMLYDLPDDEEIQKVFKYNGNLSGFLHNKLEFLQNSMLIARFGPLRIAVKNCVKTPPLL